jgi:hypothetical protein
MQRVSRHRRASPPVGVLMATPKPCTHRRWKTVKRVACTDHREDGLEPNPRQRFRVLEVMRCVKCDTAGTRWSRFYGQTERAALKRAGVPEHELPAPPNHKPKAEVSVPLTSWPFPVSTVYPEGNTQ